MDDEWLAQLDSDITEHQVVVDPWWHRVSRVSGCIIASFPTVKNAPSGWLMKLLEREYGIPKAAKIALRSFTLKPCRQAALTTTVEMALVPFSVTLE